LSSVILPAKVFECSRLLMHHLGIPGDLSAGGTQDGYGKLGGSLSNCSEIRSLLLHPQSSKGASISLLNIIEEMLGVGRVDMGSISGQIALRFPENIQDSVTCCLNSDSFNFSHMPDGTLSIGSAWHTDGFRQGKYHGFSLLVGICLSDCVDDFSGNLLLWPGSHVPIHKSIIGQHGGLDLDLLARLVNDEVSEEVNEKFSSATETTEAVVTERILHENAPTNLPSLGEPLQMHFKAGDVVLVHPDTAHCGGPNFSAVIRNMVYFRIKRIAIRESDETYRHDMWVDLPGVL
jgi:hypothetical protein